ncbi:MAG: carboxylating nicotinate-nucleotide diphosphorylase [Ruminococcaceae bacterium]|nr:carboxylating nicotinate-nucleotide diphosphorylase [Oscillospiraceae bacterium]
MYIEKTVLDKILLNALEEDLGNGDITTLSVIPKENNAHGRYIAKENGVLCGVGIAERVYQLIDSTGEVKFTTYYNDGDYVEKGTVIAEVEGPAVTLLSGERVGLNLMQRLSGIATRTAEAVKAVQGTNARVTDTRKTTPGIRVLEKYAVRVGGGSNHRFNLADGVLIKDNHIAAAGSITKAVEMARKNAHHMLKIEVEIETFEQLNEALNAGADIIMLDNMNEEDMEKAVKIINGRAISEASGNMGERDLTKVAKTGVDLISIGALTHSVHSMDISLKFNLNK